MPTRPPPGQSFVRTAYVLQRNVEALLEKRHETAADLARSFSPPKTRGWISNILSGARGMPMKYIDHIANYFGVEIYQLFMPAISPLLERRKSGDRRQGGDRRIGHAGRAAREMAGLINDRRPRRPRTHEGKETLR